jgi:hypothetical protein
VTRAPETSSVPSTGLLLGPLSTTVGAAPRGCEYSSVIAVSAGTPLAPAAGECATSTSGPCPASAEPAAAGSELPPPPQPVASNAANAAAGPRQHSAGKPRHRCSWQAFACMGILL